MIKKTCTFNVPPTLTTASLKIPFQYRAITEPLTDRVQLNRAGIK